MEILKSKLSVKNLTKEYDNNKILDNISFDLIEGEFLSILGPSGCGKTTLLRIIMGLDKANKGEIIKNNIDISNYSCSERGMGIVFQNYALFPNMTVLGNVEYALKIKKETKQEARNTALKILDLLGLSDQINKKPSKLSGGQQQRVAIARTLATNPDILLLDEPLSALDVSNREIMKNELKSLQKKFNVTIIFVTHDQEEAFYLSDRIMVMNEGVIEQLDTPTNIYQNPANDYIKEFVVDRLNKKFLDIKKYTGR